MELSELIEKLQLSPLPIEGGMFRQTYVSNFMSDDRPMGTAIYYLLSGEAFSHLHLLDVDEIYHFYLGDSVELYQIEEDGKLQKTILGHDIAAGEQVQAVVPKGVWQGSRLAPGGNWALLGTTTTPGYLDSGYTHADREALSKRFPEYDDILKMLTGEVSY